AAIHGWWEDWVAYWGYSYVEHGCNYSTTYYGDGPTTGKFATMLLGPTTVCGGGQQVSGTALPQPIPAHCPDNYVLVSGTDTCTLAPGTPNPDKNQGSPKRKRSAITPCQG
ncbi:MAG TPA: hypothetical protein VKA76_05550, partial [Gammaproteobacteria bacterium]|nr:hypothetical protein [Gammaproteobacteria bacterium]